jgi:hypothetical protein
VISPTWSNTDLAYFAGILDGEGAFGITRAMKRGHPSFHTRIAVLNTDAKLMRWLVARFGGAVSPRKTVSHTNPNSHPARWKPCWEWKISDRTVAAVVPAVLPYLVMKQDQAALLMEFRKTVQRPRVLPTPMHVVQRRDELKAQMTLLNRRGVSP